MGKGKQSIIPISIYGYELKQICGINDVTLKDWVVNCGLTAYHWKTFKPLQKREDLNPRTSIDVSTLEGITGNDLDHFLFKSDEFIQFAKEYNLHQSLHQLKDWYPELFTKTAKGPESLNSEEARELGRLRTQKQKWDESIRAAVFATRFVTKQSTPITRDQLWTELNRGNFGNIPNTSFEKIWKAIPKEFRNLGGRPKSSS